MRVVNRTIYQNIIQNINTVTEQLKDINEKISSSKRINRPSDDPVGITHALNIRETLAQLQQYGTNIKYGQSWLQMTESSLQQVEDLTVRAKEIANQMSTGTYNADQRANAAKEVQNIIEQLVQVGNTQIDGRYIYSGDKDQTSAYELNLYRHDAVADSGNNPAYTGAATSSGTYTGLYSKKYIVEITTGGAVGVATYRVSEDGGTTWGPNDAFTTDTNPTNIYDSTNSRETPPDQGVQIAFTNSGTLTAGDRFTIEVSRYNGNQKNVGIILGQSAQMNVNLNGDKVLGEAGDTANNLFDILAGLKNALENNNIDGVQASLDQLSNAQVNNTSNLADIGSRLNRMEVNNNLIADLNTNNTTRLSGIEDIDIAKAVTELSAKQLVYQAALYAATQVTQMNMLNYLG
jgi:flagellar hook-associated protein 3 FlgL